MEEALLPKACHEQARTDPLGDAAHGGPLDDSKRSTSPFPSEGGGVPETQPIANRPLDGAGDATSGHQQIASVGSGETRGDPSGEEPDDYAKSVI